MKERNNPKEATWQKLHIYEQEFGYMRGLPSKNNFQSIFPKHLWSCLTGERVSPYSISQTLGFENVNSLFSTETILLVLQ